MGRAPLFEKFMQAIFQTKKKSSLFFIRRRYATPSRRSCLWAATRREKPPGGKAFLVEIFSVRKQVTPLIRFAEAQHLPPRGKALYMGALQNGQCPPFGLPLGGKLSTKLTDEGQFQLR